MKKVILFAAIALFAACEEAPKQDLVAPPTSEPAYTIEKYFKIVKNTKETHEEHTDYVYKMDWFNGKLRHQPKVSSDTKYYVVYTDASYEEISMAQSVILSPGDTVWKTRRVTPYSGLN